MERIFSKAEGLISPYLEPPKADREVQGYFNCCTSISHGEIFCSRETTGILKDNLTKQGLCLEDLLNLELQTSDNERLYFSSLSVNPQHVQGQLCLSLNRPLIFTTNIEEVLTLGHTYGSNSSGTFLPIAGNDTFTERYLIHLYSAQGDFSHSTCTQHHHKDVVSANSLREETETCVTKTRSLTQLDLNEGRSLLVLGLLRKLLEACGHSVFCYTNIPQEVKFDDPSYSVWHLLKTMLSNDGSTQTTAPAPTQREFVEVVGDLPQHIERSGRNMWLNARGFSQELGLSGKGGYDKNLQRIQVTDGSGCLSTAATEACSVCSAICSVAAKSEASQVTVYIAKQQASFATQQSMLLREVYNKRTQQQPPSQYLLTTSGVICQSKTGQINTLYSLSDLLKLRLEQMTEAYIVKFGERAKGTQLQSIATRMAEAVVKFELLSNDPSSIVKIELPELSESGRGAAPAYSDKDIRFSGSFVMYNYARMAALLSRFQQECTKGIYSPLPKLSEVDFSLLKEEEEWQLLFHFVLQYPSMIQEAANLRKKGIGVHIEVALKKVCQFLIKLSHMFSSYYSRIKILMPPEPHLLPLIHARLYLVTAIRQVMLNGLTLLAIEPIDQL